MCLSYHVDFRFGVTFFVASGFSLIFQYVANIVIMAVSIAAVDSESFSENKLNALVWLVYRLVCSNSTLSRLWNAIVAMSLIYSCFQLVQLKQYDVAAFEIAAEAGHVELLQAQ